MGANKKERNRNVNMFVSVINASSNTIENKVDDIEQCLRFVMGSSILTHVSTIIEIYTL